jgi:hypothetical protein
MEKVTGIEGLLFRAHDPKALGRGYQQHLGISLTPSRYGIPFGSKRQTHRFRFFRGDERLFRRCPQVLDGELSSPGSRQNGGPVTSCGNRGQD